MLTHPIRLTTTDGGKIFLSSRTELLYIAGTEGDGSMVTTLLEGERATFRVQESPYQVEAAFVERNQRVDQALRTARESSDGYHYDPRSW